MFIIIMCDIFIGGVPMKRQIISRRVFILKRNVSEPKKNSITNSKKRKFTDFSEDFDNWYGNDFSNDFQR